MPDAMPHFYPFVFSKNFSNTKYGIFGPEKKIPSSVKRNRLLSYVRLPDSDGDKKKCFNNYLSTRHVHSGKNSMQYMQKMFY